MRASIAAVLRSLLRRHNAGQSRRWLKDSGSIDQLDFLGLEPDRLRDRGSFQAGGQVMYVAQFDIVRPPLQALLSCHPLILHGHTYEMLTWPYNQHRKLRTGEDTLGDAADHPTL